MEEVDYNAQLENVRIVDAYLSSVALQFSPPGVCRADVLANSQLCHKAKPTP
jgi:hypothetical protein